MDFFALDIGNTTTGLALMDQEQVLLSEYVPTGKWSSFLKKSVWQMLEKNPSSLLVVSSVVPSAWISLRTFLKRRSCYPEIYLIDYTQRKDIHMAYTEKEALGTDRLVLIYYAERKYPQDVILIVDSGTSLTIDLVVSEKHIGGIISPGLQLESSLMNQTTELLPRITIFSDSIELWGKSTEDCLMSGLLNGRNLFIKSIVQQVSRQYSQMQQHFWLTGGQSRSLKNICQWDICDANLIFQAIRFWYS